MRNYNYRGKNEIFFPIMQNSLKYISYLNKSLKTCIMEFITYGKIKSMSMLPQGWSRKKEAYYYEILILWKKMI